ncbi:MAG: medium chain dehydrogenase/reductase family protein [Rubrobacteraceae bacterium]
MGYKKVIVEEFGDASGISVVEEERLPEPGAGEARVKVEASSAVFTDMLIRRKLYPAVRQKPPITLGYDLVGVVDGLGPGVTGLSAGQRVADLTQIGGNAEYVCRPAGGLVPVPESLDAAEAETIPLSYMTAYQMLVRIANVRPGQRILIQGATGAVGTALLQLGRLLGVEMVGTASVRNQDLILEYGAKAIDYRAPDYEQQLRTAAGEGFDAVFEGSGSGISQRLVKQGGILVSYGFSGMLRDKGNSRLGLLLAAAIGFSGVFVWSILPNGKSWSFYEINGMREKHPDWFREDLGRLFDWLERGEIKPVIAHRFPIDEARQAHALLDEGGTRGRLVLVMD